MEELQVNDILCSRNTNTYTIYIYCVYPEISKSSKHLQNCLKIAETSIVVIIFNGVIFDIIDYTVTVSFCRST